MTYTLLCSQENLYFLIKKAMGKKVWQWRFWCVHGMLWWSRSLWANRILPAKQTKIVVKKFIGLYRDGLAILQTHSSLQIEWNHKDVIKMFKTAILNKTIRVSHRCWEHGWILQDLMGCLSQYVGEAWGA